eukprot:jgi/Ulvmu1/1060/UM105_0019.1
MNSPINDPVDKYKPELLMMHGALSTPAEQHTYDPVGRAAARHGQEWHEQRETEMSAICMELSAVRVGRGSAHFAALRERGQTRMSSKQNTARPQGVHKAKASPALRMQPLITALSGASNGSLSPGQGLLTPTPRHTRFRALNRERPCAPVKRVSGLSTPAAPGPSPPAVVWRHVDAGADGLGHSPGALAACELFVLQQQHRDAQAHQQKVDQKMLDLGKAAGRRVSTSRQIQFMDAAVAQADDDRSRQRLAKLTTSRRLRLAHQHEESGCCPKNADHMSLCNAVGGRRGLHDCTNTRLASCHGKHKVPAPATLTLPRGYFQGV